MDNPEPQCFNIYYLNFSKVYEISMMIDNVIPSSIQREKTNSRDRLNKKTASISSSIGTNSQQYLARIKSVIGNETSQRSINSSKLIESLDVKTTKSVLLRQIVDRCKSVSKFDGTQEGDLVKLDSVALKILNEDNLRQILMLRKDALKGFRIEGMDINNLISSLLQDYSYILYGELTTGEVIVLKIPLEIQDEFESKYNVDDLLIGHVSVIGLYKGSVTENFITSNTFNYLSAIGSQQQEIQRKVFPSSKPPEGPRIPFVSDKEVEDSYEFIDVIAIIQDVFFRGEEEQEEQVNIQKLPWYHRFWNYLKRKNRYD